jgi:hemolysin III
MALLYLSSSFYHLIQASDRLTRVLRKIDHSMIFVFIAGTCTPFCLSFPSLLAKCLSVALIWAIAVGGILFSAFFSTGSRWIRVGSYLVMGGVGAVLAIQIHAVLLPESFRWIIFGGASYILGSLIYALKWPNPSPQYFGFHEIWHIFVLLGSACHFWAIERHLQWAFS